MWNVLLTGSDEWGMLRQLALMYVDCSGSDVCTRSDVYIVD